VMRMRKSAARKWPKCQRSGNKISEENWGALVVRVRMPIIPRTSMGLAMRATWASKGWRVSCPLRLLMTSEGSDDAGEAGSSTYNPSVAHRFSRGWMLQRDMAVTGFKCNARIWSGVVLPYLEPLIGGANATFTFSLTLRPGQLHP
jgi:hypothetical protein